jgi:ABC-type amino acid transport substrate-binding protein
MKCVWVLVILMLGFGFVGDASGDDAGKPLIIGMELNYPPFEMTDASGTPTGVGVDLGRALCAYLHRPIDIQNMPFEGLIPALKTGRIDMIISSMTATDERRKSIDFSDPYLSTGLSILVKKGSPIQSIADVDKPGTVVVVKTGTTAADYVRDHFHNAQMLALQQDTACAGPTRFSTTRCRSTSLRRRIPTRRAACSYLSSTSRGRLESARATSISKNRSMRFWPTSRLRKASTHWVTNT